MAANQLVLLTRDGRELVTFPDKGLQYVGGESSYFDNDGREGKPRPTLGGRQADAVALVSSGIPGQPQKERWIGTWPSGKGSVVALFAINAGQATAAMPLFRSAVRILDVRSRIASPDRPISTMTFLTRPSRRSVTVTYLSWRDER